MDIINLSRAELSALMATTVQPTCVNMPEEVIRYMPSYMRDRVRFVNCDELPSRFDMEDELYQEPRSLEEKRELSRDIDKAFESLRESAMGKSQILTDWAEKNIASGVDVVYFDCTMGGDDDE